MKAKRLTALALAALMAASTTSVALAGEKVSNDLDFANDGYYKYNSDANRLESAAKDEFQPGDDVYIRLVEDPYDAFSSKKTYNAYGSWAIGESWVKDIDVVYRKGDIATSTVTTYDWAFTGSGILAGWTASGKGLASQDDATVKSALKNDAKHAEYVTKYINDNYDKVENAWTDNQGRYWANEESAKVGNGISGDITTWYVEGVNLGETFSTREELLAKLTSIRAEHCIYNNQVHASLESLIKFLAGGADKTKQIYVTDDKASANFGKGEDFSETQDASTYKNPITAYVFEIDNVKYYVKSDAVSTVTQDDITGASGLNITQIKKGADHTDDYYVTLAGTYVDNSAIKSSTKTVADQETEKGIQQVTGVKYLNKGGQEGDKYVTVDVNATATNMVNAAIDSTSLSWKSNTVTNTQPQYEYWVKISTKDSATTKDIDVVGTISVGTSKSSAEKDEKLSIDFTLTNANTDNDGYFDDVDSDITIEDGERAVVSFSDDAEDLIIEFGDDAWFEFNARGQGKLNLAYNTKFNRDFAYDYDHANIDFINFVAEPTTNKTGTLYIYADEDSYIYEVTSKGAKKINGAYYDDDEGAWVIRTRHLTSYAISDRRLKTIDQMEDDKNSSSSSKPSGSQGSGSGNGNYKPIPDTGR